MDRWTKTGNFYSTEIDRGADGLFYVNLYKTEEGKKFLLKVSKGYKTLNGAKKRSTDMIFGEDIV